MVPRKPVTRHLPRCWEKILSWAKRWCISSTPNYHQEKELLWYTHTFIFSKIISFIYLNHFKKDTGFGMVASYVDKQSPSHTKAILQGFTFGIKLQLFSRDYKIRQQNTHCASLHAKQKTKNQEKGRRNN